MKGAKIQSAVIDSGDEQTNRAGLLKMCQYQVIMIILSVLIPRTGNGNFLEIQRLY